MLIAHNGVWNHLITNAHGCINANYELETRNTILQKVELIVWEGSVGLDTVRIQEQIVDDA